MAMHRVIQRGSFGHWIQYSPYLLQNQSRSHSLSRIQPSSCRLIVQTRPMSSFKHTHFVAGSSDDESNSVVSLASGNKDDTIRCANLLLEPMKKVEEVVASCLQGVAKPPKNDSIWNDSAPFKRVKKSSAVPSNESSSEKQISEVVVKSSSSSASAALTSSNGPSLANLVGVVSQPPSITSTNEAKPQKTDTDLEKQMKLRAQRFGIYSAVQETISGKPSTTREYSTRAGEPAVASDSSLVSSLADQQSSCAPPLEQKNLSAQISVVSTAEENTSSDTSAMSISMNAQQQDKKMESLESDSNGLAITASIKTSAISLNSADFPPVPMHLMTQISSILRKGDYNCRITPPVQQSVSKLLGAYHKVLTLEALRSIRHTLLADRAMMVHARLPQKEIAERYETGESIASIAKAYAAPAFACFRLVLKERGLNPKYIKDAIAGRVKLENERDARQRKAAMEIDTTTAELDDRLGASLLFEDDIAKYLRDRGIKFKTQHDMKGHALTPDFVIDESTPLIIGSHAIRWIDAKNFFGGVSKGHISKIKKQANKYADVLGHGALIFSMGFCDELTNKMENDKVAVFDYRWLVPDYVAIGHLDKNAKKVKSEAAAEQAVAPILDTTPEVSPLEPVSEIITGTKRAAPEEQHVANPVKRLKFTSLGDMWNHVFAAIRAIGFTGHVTQALVDEVNEVIASFDPEIEPFNLQHVEIIHRDIMCDLRQDAERNKDLRSAATQKRYLQLYNSGKSVLDISSDESVPPLLVVRNILEARGVSWKDIDRVTKPTITLATLTSMMVRDKILKEREVEDMAQIIEQNLFFYPPEQVQFEHSVFQFLQSVNVQVTVREQPWRHFILNSALTIEGQTVKWIFTSDNFGGASKRHTARLKSIAGTLANTIGPGAIVFACGFTDKTLLEPCKDVILVDFRLLTLA